ncbi:28230_t:CDS:2 [Gigaspora margarita]|uniref:28230_t:CDS:1 n=1 Tax=Gigaspora margarita TaxID=4874 RepID=A0ABN7UTU3_GIGMA|nr:28230_t:CDS:2 [Gigaspora margarita]
MDLEDHHIDQETKKIRLVDDISTHTQSPTATSTTSTKNLAKQGISLDTPTKDLHMTSELQIKTTDPIFSGPEPALMKFFQNNPYIDHLSINSHDDPRIMELIMAPMPITSTATPDLTQSLIRKDIDNPSTLQLDTPDGMLLNTISDKVSDATPISDSQARTRPTYKLTRENIFDNELWNIDHILEILSAEEKLANFKHMPTEGEGMLELPITDYEKVVPTINLLREKYDFQNIPPFLLQLDDRPKPQWDLYDYNDI